jgi:hypothetical protein
MMPISNSLPSSAELHQQLHTASEDLALLQQLLENIEQPLGPPQLHHTASQLVARARHRLRACTERLAPQPSRDADEVDAVFEDAPLRLHPMAQRALASNDLF